MACDLRVLRSGKKMARRGPEETKPRLPSSAPPLPSRPSLPTAPQLGASSHRLPPPSPPPPPPRAQVAMDKVVCEICGSSGRDPDLIAKCVQCSSYQHRYCMPVVAFSIPPEWRCSECQENGCVLTKDKETPKVDLLHQTSPPTRKKGSKVKYISSEEVVSLTRETRERRPYGRSNFAMRQSQVRSMSPSLKQPSNMMCTSPTRSDSPLLALNQCSAASRDKEKIENRSDVYMQQNQVRPSSPTNLKQSSRMMCMSPIRNGGQVHSTLKQSTAASLDKANIEDRSEFSTRKSQVPPASSANLKQPSNRNCLPPSKSDTQVHALKRCAVVSHEARNKDLSMNRGAGYGSSMPSRCATEVIVKGKSDSQIEDKTEEKKTVSANEGTISSQIQSKSIEKEALRGSVVDVTGCQSEVSSPFHNTDTLLIIDSSAANPRRPSSENCWTGSFTVLNAGTRHNLGGFKAYFPPKVSRKAYDVAKMMSGNMQLEMLPRFDDWPKAFETSRPTHEDIGLFFSPHKFDCHEKKHSNLLETSCNYVMRASIKDIKLLIYSSEVLPPDSQYSRRSQRGARVGNRIRNDDGEPGRERQGAAAGDKHSLQRHGEEERRRW
ncbi:hypothetical protein EJB05_06087, partial [Eragrostis curvula]